MDYEVRCLPTASTKDAGMSIFAGSGHTAPAALPNNIFSAARLTVLSKINANKLCAIDSIWIRL